MRKNQEILTKAIKSLSETINVSTGLAHPLDDSRAKELLRALRQRGIATPGDEVYSLAISNNWPERHARAFAELAERVDQGSSIRVSHPRDWGELTVLEIIASVGE